jgi:hypothetical protein
LKPLAWASLKAGDVISLAGDPRNPAWLPRSHVISVVTPGVVRTLCGLQIYLRQVADTGRAPMCKACLSRRTRRRFLSL